MKKITKITAFILCAVILSLSAAVFASAEPSGTSEPEYQMITSIPISVSLYVGENLSNPSIKVGFKIEKNSTVPNFESIDPADDTIEFLADSVAAGTTASREVELRINNFMFTAPGTYCLKLTEVYNDDARAIYPVQGVSYDPTPKYAYFYVNGNPDYDSGTVDQPEYMCYAVIVTTTNSIPAVPNDGKVANKLSDDKIPFFNSYRSENDDPDEPIDPNFPKGSLYNLTINNEVTERDVPNTSREINYLVTLDTANSERKITIVPTVGSSIEVDSGNASTFSIKLKHGESFTVYGLASGEKFGIERTNAKDFVLVYSRSATDTLSDFTFDGNAATASATINKDAYVTLKNQKTLIIPTGIFLNYKHYWVMLGAALLLVVAFVGKRRNRVENEI